MFLVDAVVQLFKLGAFTTTCRSERTVLAIGLAASVRTFGVALTIGFFALEKEFGLVAFGFGALVIIIFFIENKTFPLGFVLSKIWEMRSIHEHHKKQ